MGIKSKFFDYILVFYAINVSGNPFFIYREPIKHYIIFLCLVGIRIIYRALKRETNIFNPNLRVLLGLIVVLNLLSFSMLFNSDTDVVAYINIFIRIIGAYLLACAINLQSFSNIYIRIMVFLAVASIILYGINQFYPQITNTFGQLPNSTIVLKVDGMDYRTYVNGIYLYTFLVNFGFGTADVWAYSRNNGIFWEPGAYQFFLNLALILLVEKFNDNKYKRIFFMILAITVLSTGSSTGLISLLAICLVYRKEVGGYFKYYLIKFNLIFIILSAFFVVFIVKYSDYMFNSVHKIRDELGRPDYILERIGLSYASELLNGMHVIYGFGITELRTMEASGTLNNTYAYYLFAFGIFYALNILYMYFRNYKRNFKRYLGAYLVLIIGLTSEVFILYPVVLAMMFFMDKKVMVNGKLEVKQ